MPKFSINATELTNTDVNFVALVKRGANRIPFRITKTEDNDMIDLHSIGKRIFKSADPEPRLVAAIVEKSADIAAITATLKAAGIDVAAFAKSEKDGVVTMVHKGDAPSDVMLVKMAGGVVLAYEGLSKAFDGYDFQSPDFGEVHSKGSHMSSMSTAADSLHRTLGNVMETAPDPKTACQQIGDACDAHKAHIQALTKKLPTQAFKADQALLKAEVAVLLKASPDLRKHPHAGVAMAIAHAAHQAALTAQKAGDMLTATGTSAMAAGGAGDDQNTGGGFGSQGDGAPLLKKTAGQEDGIGDVNAEDPEMPAKNAKKADAGKNGTGAGVEDGEGTGTNGSATADDAANTEVNATGDENVSGSNSGINTMLKAPTKKSAIAAARLSVAKAELELLLAKDEGQEDEDNTNGAQNALPAKAKASTAKADIKGLPQPTGESAAGEGIEGALDTRANVSDEDVTGSTVNTGKVKGKTLDLAGVPAKLIAKAETDGEIGKKGKGNSAADDISGAGALETNVQQMKADNAAIMQAVKALSKTMGDSVTALTKQVEAVTVLAKKNDAALSGTVFSDAGDDNVRTQKSERSGAPPLMDTAFNRRTA